MRILYLDCFSGVAGDMLLGALVDLGVPLGEIKRQLSALPMHGYSIACRKAVRGGISGTKLDVRIGRGHHHRGWKEIREIIDGADLPEAISGRALRIFRRLIEAEARIHRLPAEKVHLHEVGAVDAIVDVVGSVIGLHHLLGSGGRLHVSPLHLGRGSVKMEHGTFPVPPPATLALLEGVPVRSGPVEGELVTPTGAAIVSTIADGFGPMPPLSVRAVGYGAGSRDYEDHPNVLRAILGDAESSPHTLETVVVAECTIDDMNPQAYGHLMERLFAAGALEVFYTPVQMKKGRPGILVTVISPPARFGDLAGVIFRESTTIGLRHRQVERIELAREIRAVATPFGRIRIKVSSYGGKPVQAQPEYEDCRRIAASRGVPLKEVLSAALAAYAAIRPPIEAAAPDRGGAKAGARGGGRRSDRTGAPRGKRPRRRRA